VGIGPGAGELPTDVVIQWNARGLDVSNCVRLAQRVSGRKNHEDLSPPPLVALIYMIETISWPNGLQIRAVTTEDV